jgi:zinc-ribbon domain
MFCPKCATQNVDGASYCRSCGANIRLVPQALEGQLPTNNPPNPPDDYYYGRRRRRGAPSMDYAIRSLMMGVAFAVMAVMTSKFAPGSGRWWFWLLVPAIMMFSRGVSEIIRANARKNQQQQPPSPQPMVNAVRTSSLPAPRTGELMTPVPSVTEGTTRHLGVENKTRPFEFSDTQKPS